MHTEPRVGPGRLAHGRLHLLLTLNSLVVVLVSINRKSSGTLAFVAENGFLRWVEINNMRGHSDGRGAGGFAYTLGLLATALIKAV
ncbi:hypothetical protein [Streptomyces sp. NPDC001020]